MYLTDLIYAFRRWLFIGASAVGLIVFIGTLIGVLMIVADVLNSIGAGI